MIPSGEYPVHEINPPRSHPKVARIRYAVRTGTYRVDTRLVAESVIARLYPEMAPPRAKA